MTKSKVTYLVRAVMHFMTGPPSSGRKLAPLNGFKPNPLFNLTTQLIPQLAAQVQS
jgi:hypothetical protein